MDYYPLAQMGESECERVASRLWGLTGEVLGFHPWGRNRGPQLIHLISCLLFFFQECCPPLAEIARWSFPRGGESQGLARSQGSGRAWSWKNHLGGHGVSPAGSLYFLPLKACWAFSRGFHLPGGLGEPACPGRVVHRSFERTKRFLCCAAALTLQVALITLPQFVCTCVRVCV